METSKLVVLVIMVIISLIGRQYIELDIDEKTKKQPLFKLVVIYSIMFVNTRDYYISFIGTIIMFALLKLHKVEDKTRVIA